MLWPGQCRLFCCIVLAVLLTMPLTEKKAAGLQALGTAPSLPLIQALLEQMPPKPRVLWKRQVSNQHLNYMLDLYRKSADQDGRPRVNRTVGSNTVQLVKPSGRSQEDVQDRLIQNLEFHLKAFPELKHLVRAVLVYSHIQLLAGSWLSCKVELLADGGVTLQHPVGSTKTSILQRGTSRTSDIGKKWAELDLTSHLKSFAGEFEKKHSQPLRIRHLCNWSENMTNPLPWQKAKDLASHRLPFLVLYLNSTSPSPTKADVVLNVPSFETETKTSIGATHSRRARQAGNIGLKLPSYRQKNSVGKNQCTLHPFRVSFHQLGWDHWIIAPHKYNPKYCKGDCPRVLRYGYNSPNHAIVQNFINELVNQSVPRPSCVPYKYSPISVLMIEPNGSILYKEYENMIAESCTCR